MNEQPAPGKMSKLLYLKHAAQRGRPNATTYRDIYTQLGCIDSDLERSEKLVRLLLRGISETNSSGGDLQPIAYPIGRIEIFCDAHLRGPKTELQDQGLVLFDILDQPVVHVFHALLGHNGNGALLTKAILSELAIPDHIFHEIQRKYWGIRNTNVPYYVVVQSTKREDGLLDWHWASIERPARS